MVELIQTRLYIDGFSIKNIPRERLVDVYFNCLSCFKGFKIRIRKNNGRDV